jgi:hypothetical protein
MKLGKLTLIIAIAAMAFASCTKPDTLYYTCKCNSSVDGGSTEIYTIKSDDETKAKEQCESYAKPPTDLRATCALQ